MNKALGQKAIENRLNKAFLNKYKEYESVTEWYVNPADNIWKFQIKELNIIATLECNIFSGKVTEIAIPLR